MNFQKYFLVDNGSLRPESILCLREVAESLKFKTGVSILPAGIMHSHKIDPCKLNGIPALSMQSFFKSFDEKKVESLAFIPMFLGPSLAITDWLHNQLREWKRTSPARKYVIAGTLFREGDDRIALALKDYVVRELTVASTRKPYIILVDHGTPLKEVNKAREHVGRQLAKLVANDSSGFSTACMERRVGSEYDFNDPLLEKVLQKVYAAGGREVILAPFFLAPGRHAGPNGDLASICLPFEKNGMRILRTPTLGNHPLILDILTERFLETNAEGY